MTLTVTESDGLINRLSRKKKKKRKKAYFIAFVDFHGVNILCMAPFIIAVPNNWLSEHLKI